MSPLQATHAYALVGVAQYLAVQRADMAVGSDGRSQVEAERGAVAGASAAVLTYLFPGAAQAFEDLVTEQANAGLGQPHPWFTRGEAIGPEGGARIAAYWALNTGTVTASGFWLQVATDDINAQGLSEREATHLYALVSATMFDAVIGCWDAKLVYWLIRPWKADPAITVVAAVGKPNHPSYPSGHSCVSSSGVEVLSTFFP